MSDGRGGFRLGRLWGGGAGSSDSVAAAERQKNALLRLLRAGFVVLVLTVTLLNILDIGSDENPGEQSVQLATNWWIPLAAVIVLSALVLAADVLSPNKKLQTIGGAILGIVAGLTVTLAIGFVIDLVATTWEVADSNIVAAVKVIVGICMCYLGISTVLQTQDDFRLVIPYVEFAKQIRGPRPLLLDTSTLIDARIAEIGQTGLLQTPLVIPTFVIDELQQLADSSDSTRRAKGRRGLDMVARLQRAGNLDVSVDETPVPGKAVDQMLVELARRMPAVVVTTDAALAKICSLQGARCVNLHELASAMRPAFVAGDGLTLRLMRAGEQPGQAVGYLDDGTMVIAENGAGRIGETVSMTVRTTLQTQAGKLVFARLDDGAAGGKGEAETGPEAGPETGPVVERAGEGRAAGVSPRRGPGPTAPPQPNPRRNPRRSSAG